jgi:hypothetical protein
VRYVYQQGSAFCIISELNFLLGNFYLPTQIQHIFLLTATRGLPTMKTITIDLNYDATNKPTKNGLMMFSWATAGC